MPETEIEDSLYEQIKALCAEGEALLAEDSYEAALLKYEAAWLFLPEPRMRWTAATWILAAIGDVYWHMGRFTEAREALSDAMHAPEAIGNPFLHLRLGECCFELGLLDRAADELTRVYALEGAEMFAHEDPKYLAFLRTRIAI